MPKGGGAIRGIGEKFAVNPSTGTGTLSVPIAASPGRSGFGPQLALSYDSGAGNSPFGLGWTLGVPAITRRTDRGLPKYRDAEESDVFVLSGAEDLVPLTDPAAQPTTPRTVHGVSYEITAYRPRIEGLFARIERWVAVESGIGHWRSISRDNVTTLYGFDDDSRIADPADERRVFSYLACRTFDDKGNVMVYEYVPEDPSGVDVAAAHEATAQRRGTRDAALPQAHPLRQHEPVLPRPGAGRAYPSSRCPRLMVGPLRRLAHGAEIVDPAQHAPEYVRAGVHLFVKFAELTRTHDSGERPAFPTGPRWVVQHAWNEVLQCNHLRGARLMSRADRVTPQTRKEMSRPIR